MDSKAQQLGAERLLDMLGVGRIEPVLLRKPPVRPVFAADFVQFAKHEVAQPT